MPSDWGTNPSQARSNTQILPAIRFVRKVDGGQAPISEFIVGTADFNVGDFVAFDANGNLISATGSANKLVGVAMRTAAAGQKVEVVVGGPSVVFDISCQETLGTATGNRFAAIVSTTGTYRQLIATASTATSRGASHALQVVGLPAGHSDSAHSNYRRAHVVIVVPDVGVGSAR
jgi:hypothetical protein